MFSYYTMPTIYQYTSCVPESMPGVPGDDLHGNEKYTQTRDSRTFY